MVGGAGADQRRRHQALSEADGLAVAAVSWFELAWLAERERIVVTIPVRSWLGHLAARIRTLPLTPAIADTAVSLPSSFPGDSVDRLIDATPSSTGCDSSPRTAGCEASATHSLSPSGRQPLALW